MANDCDFALSACCHSGSSLRASKICDQLDTGMFAINDLEGTTYLSQSLPFGGAWRAHSVLAPVGLHAPVALRTI